MTVTTMACGQVKPNTTPNNATNPTAKRAGARQGVSQGRHVSREGPTVLNRHGALVTPKRSGEFN